MDINSNDDKQQHITEHNIYKEMVRNYKQAIDVIDEIRKNQDWEVVSSLITHLAKNHTQVLMDSYEKVTNHLFNLDRELIFFICNNRKIDAVRLYRKKTGCSLRVAKEYCDKLQEERSVLKCH